VSAACRKLHETITNDWDRRPKNWKDQIRQPLILHPGPCHTLVCAPGEHHQQGTFYHAEARAIGRSGWSEPLQADAASPGCGLP
jgi:hypothetical protein